MLWAADIAVCVRSNTEGRHHVEGSCQVQARNSGCRDGERVNTHRAMWQTWQAWMTDQMWGSVHMLGSG